jgi:hypothetical protein
MCKSAAEGGQRCFTDAKTAVENKTAAFARTQARFDEGKATEEQVMAAAEATADAMIDYASTLDGAQDLLTQYDQIALSGVLDSDDFDVADAAAEQAESILSLVDDGAKRAAENRAVENAYRATQGKPPLTTSLPKTFDEIIAAAEAQQREAEVQQREAEAKAAKEADPFGLRAEASTGWTFDYDGTVSGRNVIPSVGSQEIVYGSSSPSNTSLPAASEAGSFSVEMEFDIPERPSLPPEKRRWRDTLGLTDGAWGTGKSSGSLFRYM